MATKSRIELQIRGWAKEILEMLAILAAILIISRLILGAHMLVPLVAVTSQSMLHTDDGWKLWLQSHGIPEERISTFPLQNGFAMGDMIIIITPDGKGTILPLFPDTQLGDVIIYRRDKLHSGKEPIIHRVVGIVRVKDWQIESIEGTLGCLKKEDFENRYIPYIKNCVSGSQCPYNQFPDTGTFRFYITKGDNHRSNRMPDQCGNNGVGSIALPVNEKQVLARGWIRIPYVGWLKLLLNYILNYILGL